MYVLDVSIDKTSATIVERDGVATFTIKARVTPCQDIPNDPTTIDYVVAPPSWSGAQGWTVSVTPLGLGGQSLATEVTFTATVGLVAPGTVVNSIDVTLLITSRPSPAASSSPLPLNTPGHDDPSTDTVDFEVRRELTTSEAITDFADKNRWWLAAAALAIIAAGVVLARTRRKGVRVTCDNDLQEVLPGRGANFAVTILNETHENDTFSLTAAEVNPGWAVILPTDSIEIGRGREDTVWLTVKAPMDAKEGQRASVEMFVASRRKPGTEGRVLVEAVVVERGPSFAGSEPVPPMAPPSVSPPPEMHEPSMPRQEPRLHVEDVAPRPSKPAKRTPRKR